MSEIHDVLEASLNINNRLSAEVDALKKHASRMSKQASGSFSKGALERVANVLVDCGFVKSAAKGAFVTMCTNNPNKVLEAFEKVASQVVKPVNKPESVGNVVSKSAGWFSVSKSPKEDPYKDCFGRY